MSFDKAQLELAWAAGFFDGEGNISFGNKPTRRSDGSIFKGIMLQIGQAGNSVNPPEVLTRFRNAVNGIGVIMGPYSDKRGPNRKKMWRYQASGYKAVTDVVSLLLPYLGLIKIDQANAKIAEWEAQPRLKKGPKCQLAS